VESIGIKKDSLKKLETTLNGEGVLLVKMVGRLH